MKSEKMYFLKLIFNVMGYHNILLKCESIFNNDIIEVQKCATQKTSIQ
jgi:hypothetical protein